jgi:hypothetical protein
VLVEIYAPTLSGRFSFQRAPVRLLSAFVGAGLQPGVFELPPEIRRLKSCFAGSIVYALCPLRPGKLGRNELRPYKCVSALFYLSTRKQPGQEAGLKVGATHATASPIQDSSLDINYGKQKT